MTAPRTITATTRRTYRSMPLESVPPTGKADCPGAIKPERSAVLRFGSLQSVDPGRCAEYDRPCRLCGCSYPDVYSASSNTVEPSTIGAGVGLGFTSVTP